MIFYSTMSSEQAFICKNGKDKHLIRKTQLEPDSLPLLVAGWVEEEERGAIRQSEEM